MHKEQVRILEICFVGTGPWGMNKEFCGSRQKITSGLVTRDGVQSNKYFEEFFRVALGCKNMTCETGIMIILLGILLDRKFIP